MLNGWRSRGILLCMSEATRPPEGLGRLADIARNHEHRTSLSALAYTVLARQAEGRSLFAGKKYLRQQAREHGLRRADADTHAGNLLRILEKGPAGACEYGLVAAFAVLGLSAALRSGDEVARAELAVRTERHLTWLDLATGYRLQPFLLELLEEDALASVADAACQAVLADQAKDAGARARNAARLTLLLAIDPEGTRVERLLEHASDPLTRRMVSPASAPPSPTSGAPAASSSSPPASSSSPPASSSSPPASSSSPSASSSSPPPRAIVDGARAEARVRARIARPPAGPALGLLRLLSGWALAVWILRGLGMVLGVRRVGSFSLEPAGVRVATETRAAGRIWGELDQVVRLDEVRFGRRHVRYPAVRRLVGLLSFCLGALTGALVLYDGAAIMESTLLGLGAAIIGAGCLLDLVFDVVLAGSRRQVLLELGIGGRRFCLKGVPADQADAFMDALSMRAS